ncbi:hypothetical protein ACGP04_07425 [Piscirickettsia salmonis]|uniref:hypothetical protein n=1 Tax=Piscirickettsia salmonis TaxID=1238 RepID=UPI003752E9D3
MISNLRTHLNYLESGRNQAFDSSKNANAPFLFHNHAQSGQTGTEENQATGLCRNLS